jgi:hypothetical protein
MLTSHHLSTSVLFGHFSGFSLTSLTSLAHTGCLAIRNHSIATRNRFPWPPGRHSGAVGIAFVFDVPSHCPATLGPSRALFPLFSHLLDLPSSHRVSCDSQSLNCDSEPLSLASWPPFRCFGAPLSSRTPSHCLLTLVLFRLFRRAFLSTPRPPELPQVVLRIVTRQWQLGTAFPGLLAPILVIWGSVVFENPLPPPVDFGHFRALRGLFSHPLDLPSSLRWPGDSHPLDCDSKPLSLAS